MGDGPDASLRRGRAAATLARVAAVSLLALAIRALGFETVLQDGQAVFPPTDPQYHLRRAFYSFVNFPDVLLFDVYINHPGGAAISWPPLFDLAIAAVARLLARDVHGFELVAAWAPPVLGAATVVPLWLCGRALGSERLGLGAGCIFAFLPMSFFYSALGFTDHHAAVTLIGAWLLVLCMWLVEPDASRRAIARRAIGLAVAQLAMLLTWHGSLLYLALVQCVLLVAAIRSGSRRLPGAQAAAALATLLVVVPVLWASPEPLGGAYSAIALSWLHVLAMTGVAVVAGALSLAGGRMRGDRAGSRLALVVVASCAIGGGVLLLPGARAGLMPALGFLTMSDGAGVATNEQRALFAIFGRAAEEDPTAVWGWFAYLLPLAPVAPWLRARRLPAGTGPRAAAFVLAPWCAYFAALAISQLRYGNDCAPAAALSFATLLGGVARATVARLRRSTPDWVAAGVAVAGFCVLIAPAVTAVYLPRAQGSLAFLRGDRAARESAAASVPATAARFLRDVRQVTPETSGYLDDWRDAASPEYGVLAHPNLGHAIQYLAQRATGTDPFWAYIGERNWAFTADFLGARSEQQALRAARTLDGRYVITMPTLEEDTVSWRLHFFDGNAAGQHPALEHFRLIIESLGAGQSLLSQRRPDPPGSLAYKLFEIVEGARLPVVATPGSDVAASISLVTPSGRVFEYSARGRADADGNALLVLPYPTRGSAPVRAQGAYRVRVGDVTHALDVSEVAVREGRTIGFDPLRGRARR